MVDTPNLGMTLLTEGGATQEVPANEAFRDLDTLVQLAVIDRDLTAPPGSPSDGDRYIPAATATGDWTGDEGTIQEFRNGAWNTKTPKEGWMVWVEDEDVLLVHDGTDFDESLTGRYLLERLVLSPSGADLTLGRAPKDLVVVRLSAVLRGTTPSVDFTVRFDSDRSAAGTEVVTGGTTVTSTTTGTTVTSLNNAAISADDWIWLETSGESGTVDEFFLVVDCRVA